MPKQEYNFIWQDDASTAVSSQATPKISLAVQTLGFNKATVALLDTKGWLSNRHNKDGKFFFASVGRFADDIIAIRKDAQGAAWTTKGRPDEMRKVIAYKKTLGELSLLPIGRLLVGMPKGNYELFDELPDILVFKYAGKY